MEIGKKQQLELEAKEFFQNHKKEIFRSMKHDQIVNISFDMLSKFSPMLSEKLLEIPEEIIALLEVALDEIGLIKNPRIRFATIPDSARIKIKEIRAKHLDQFIAIEGIVRQASDVRPQVVNARFECPTCGAILSVLQIDRKFREPSRCSCGRKGLFKLLSKEMVDAQRLVIEESPDTLEGGEQPRRMNVFLKEDLVDPKMEDRTTPGSKVKIIGVLKEVPVPLPQGSISTRFDLAIEANNAIPLEETFDDLEVSDKDEEEIRKIATSPKAFEKLISSIAPSVYGFKEVKEAILLQLFSGVKKKRSDGGNTRGDIHVLLVGDPGVAKSITLKFMARIGPKGRYVSGKSATGTGLTASVIKDEFLKGWSLEAGAMVLSNKGFLAIDEIEKMDEHDRSALHEALEQQCYLPDLEINFADGSSKKIGDFIDELLANNKDKIQQGIDCEILKLNDEIKIFTTDFDSIYSSKIYNISRHIAPKQFIKITLRNGRSIKVTPNHPCWTISDGKIATMPASALKENQFFPIPSIMPIDGQEQRFEISPYKNGPNLCKFIGYHITDGCYELNRGKKNGVQFSNNDKALIDDYFNSIENLFNKKPIITSYQNKYAVRVISKDVVDFIKGLDKNLMEKGIIKSIPDKIMECKKEDLAYLIRAAFDGDGTVVNVKRGGCRISLSAENSKFANQVSDILLRFGIVCSIYKDKEFFKLDICGHENLEKFYENISFLSQKKLNRLKNYLSAKKTYRSITDVIPNVSHKISSILKTLHINIERTFGGQVSLQNNKHRMTLQKYIKVAETKIQRILDIKETIINSNSNKELSEFRKLLEIPLLYLSDKMNISNYMLSKIENSQEFNKDYKALLINELNIMLEVLPALREIKKLTYSQVRWSKIKEVKLIENKDVKCVYDLRIEPTHSFISNGMVLHNSVSISKANIQATLRTETTVLAAGNPKLGRFDPLIPIPQQINISPALLSRFDVIFILRDLPNRAQDEAIASHVLEEHKQEVERDVIDPKLLRKYVAFARKNIKPKLTDEAADEIKEFYISIRNKAISSTAEIKPIPITARQLEAIVRLSEASAKLRLSNYVSLEDTKRAIALLKYSMSQVGFDEETQSFDIDRVVTGIPTSKRSKIIIVRETISKLESSLGKLIPIAELEKEIGERLSKEDLEDAITQLAKSGDIFKPKTGYIQKL